MNHQSRNNLQKSVKKNEITQTQNSMDIQLSYNTYFNNGYFSYYSTSITTCIQLPWQRDWYILVVMTTVIGLYA